MKEIVVELGHRYDYVEFMKPGRVMLEETWRMKRKAINTVH